MTARPIEFVGIGEILFDIFEDGTSTLGGAPANVAIHCHRLLSELGLGRASIVSAVGDDSRGRAIRTTLAADGLPLDCLSTVARPTGTAEVFVKNGQPGFEIAQDVAWDQIAASATTDALASRCGAVCFGSVAQRSPLSRQTIQQFLRLAAPALRLYDVNFRRSTRSGRKGYSREIVESSCRMATIVKANREEMIELGEMFGVAPGGKDDERSMWLRMGYFLDNFGVEAVVVTRAELGAMAMTRDEQVTTALADANTGEIHPVGAGDAFSAGLMFGRAQGWPWSTTMELAAIMGAWVTRHVSAIPPLSAEILDFARAGMTPHGGTR